MESKVTYAEALRELDKILADLNSPTADIDTLAAKVKRANELIASCRARLRKVEEEIETING